MITKNWFMMEKMAGFMSGWHHKNAADDRIEPYAKKGFIRRFIFNIKMEMNNKHINK